MGIGSQFELWLLLFLLDVDFFPEEVFITHHGVLMRVTVCQKHTQVEGVCCNLSLYLVHVVATLFLFDLYGFYSCYGFLCYKVLSLFSDGGQPEYGVFLNTQGLPLLCSKKSKKNIVAIVYYTVPITRISTVRWARGSERHSRNVEKMSSWPVVIDLSRLEHMNLYEPYRKSVITGDALSFHV